MCRRTEAYSDDIPLVVVSGTDSGRLKILSFEEEQKGGLYLSDRGWRPGGQ
jgi:hypothetical protein